MAGSADESRMIQPRVSILIPNFNNGRASSKSGDRDFITELFESLVATLENDPTPLEIIVADDGSTDDSLATCRAWAERSWRTGKPFCRLIEFTHRGVLAAVANDLTREARGEFICRLDGDIICTTPNWVKLIVEAFESMPADVGVIGPKQIGLDGRIHAAGTWILHPRGRHNIAQGALPSLITRSLECDDVMGCFYCHRKKVWKDVGGYDEKLLRGQTEDFSLMARLKGRRVISIPNVEFVHAHAARKKRENHADTPDGIDQSLDSFQEKWGFDRLTPDLDAVAKRYAGTPLLWNARVFGPRQASPANPKPVSIENSEWTRFINDAAFRDAIRARAQIVQNVNRLVSPVGRVLHVHSRGGLLCHLMAQGGVECTGADPNPSLTDLASQAVKNQTYAKARPQYTTMADETTIPLADQSFDTVLLFDCIERHHNPVALLREAHRVLRENGLAVFIVRERAEPFDADHDGLHAYRPHELVLQVQASRLFDPQAVEGLGSLPGAMILVAKRRAAGKQSFYPTRKIAVEMSGQS